MLKVYLRNYFGKVGSRYITVELRYYFNFLSFLLCHQGIIQIRSFFVHNPKNDYSTALTIPHRAVQLAFRSLSAKNVIKSNALFSLPRNLFCL